MEKPLEQQLVECEERVKDYEQLNDAERVTQFKQVVEQIKMVKDNLEFGYELAKQSGDNGNTINETIDDETFKASYERVEKSKDAIEHANSIDDILKLYSEISSDVAICKKYLKNQKIEILKVE